MKVKSRNMLRVPGWFNQVKKAVRSRITHKIYQSFAPVLISIKMSNTRIIDSKIELLINQFAIWLMREQIVTEPIWRPSHPSRVRGLKSEWVNENYMKRRKVAPFTGAWIEILSGKHLVTYALVAPFTGAWIEIECRKCRWGSVWTSHPSRVRGLKFSEWMEKEVEINRRTLHGCVDWNTTISAI